MFWSRESSVGISTCYSLKVPGSIPGKAILYLFHSFQIECEPHIQKASEAIFQGLKRQGRETNRPFPSSAEVKNDGAIPPFANVSSWYCA
jgi:hypothetical protein